MRLIESLLANLNRESRLAKYIESAQLYTQPESEMKTAIVTQKIEVLNIPFNQSGKQIYRQI